MAAGPGAADLGLLLTVLVLAILVAVVLAGALRSSRRALRDARDRIRWMISPSDDLATVRLKLLEYEIARLEPHASRRVDLGTAGQPPETTGEPFRG